MLELEKKHRWIEGRGQNTLRNILSSTARNILNMIAKKILSSRMRDILDGKQADTVFYFFGFTLHGLLCP